MGQLGDGRLRRPRGGHGRRRRRCACSPCGLPANPGRAPRLGRRSGEREAFRISTGGVVPEGADAVVRVEDTDQYEGGRAGDDGTGEVKVLVEVEPGRDIRRAGEDIRSGDAVLKAGTVLGSAELGVLASIGLAEPECARRPTLAIVCTGDELLAPSEPMRPGGVRNSNAYTLPALARLAGAEVMSVERCEDDEATRAAMARATPARPSPRTRAPASRSSAAMSSAASASPADAEGRSMAARRSTRSRSSLSSIRGATQDAVGYPAVPEEDCIFCKIVAGELPSSGWARTARGLVLDINPWSRGHALGDPAATLRATSTRSRTTTWPALRARPNGSRSGSATVSAPTA